MEEVTGQYDDISNEETKLLINQLDIILNKINNLENLQNEQNEIINNKINNIENLQKDKHNLMLKEIEILKSTFYHQDNQKQQDNQQVNNNEDKQQQQVNNNNNNNEIKETSTTLSTLSTTSKKENDSRYEYDDYSLYMKTIQAKGIVEDIQIDLDFLKPKKKGMGRPKKKETTTNSNTKTKTKTTTQAATQTTTTQTVTPTEATETNKEKKNKKQQRIKNPIREYLIDIMSTNKRTVTIFINFKEIQQNENLNETKIRLYKKEIEEFKDYIYNDIKKKLKSDNFKDITKIDKKYKEYIKDNKKNKFKSLKDFIKNGNHNITISPQSNDNNDNIENYLLIKQCSDRDEINKALLFIKKSINSKVRNLKSILNENNCPRNLKTYFPNATQSNFTKYREWYNDGENVKTFLKACFKFSTNELTNNEIKELQEYFKFYTLKEPSPYNGGLLWKRRKLLNDKKKQNNNDDDDEDYQEDEDDEDEDINIDDEEDDDFIECIEVDEQ